MKISEIIVNETASAGATAAGAVATGAATTGAGTPAPYAVGKVQRRISKEETNSASPVPKKKRKKSKPKK